MWGCFSDLYSIYSSIKVFPTHVGVFLVPGSAPTLGQSLPHACGGVSDGAISTHAVRQSSPRMWGCFSRQAGDGCAVTVFPTHVGVFPRPDQSNARPSHPPFPACTVTRQGAPNRLDAASVPITTRPVFALFRKPPSSTPLWTKAPVALLSLLPQCYILLRADREAGHSSGEQP